MTVIHDPAVRASIEARLSRLRADSTPVWGRMTADQMLWHVNQALATSLGRLTPPPNRMPLPRALVRFFGLTMPWPRNSPTNATWVARRHYDFDAELQHCRALIAEIVSRPITDTPGTHPLFGQMSGTEQSRLHAKHLDHHLRQFGV